MSSDNNQSFFVNLMERRFFPFLGSYLLGAWAVVQFVDWIANRFDFSTIWSEAILLFFVILIPSAILIIYFHGQSGTQKWSKLEKVFIPINILLAIFLSFNFFTEKDVATALNNTPADTTSGAITVVDEEGNEIQRLVPTTDQTRRIVCFPFINEDDKSTDNWEQIGLPKLLSADLEQDNRLYALSPLSLNNEYKEYGYEINKKAPFSIIRKIADDYYADLFFTGTYKKVNDLYTLSVEAFFTRDGKSFFTAVKEGENIFQLIDDITHEFQKNLSLPDLEKDIPVIDLPSSNLYSSDVKVYQNFINASIANSFDNDPIRAIELSKKAVELDPSCVECNSLLGYYLIRLNRNEESMERYKKAMQQIDKLPERQQLNIKYRNYQANSEVEKMITLANMWMQFYPNDYKPYAYLIGIYSRRAEFDAAKNICQKAINVGHKGNIFLLAASIANAQNQTDKAKEFYQKFQEAYPNKVKETIGLADIYIQEGNYDKAREHLERLEVLNNNDPAIPRSLANVEYLTNNLDKSIGYMNKALALSNNPRDSFSVYLQLEGYYIQLGQINKSIELKYKRHEVQRSFQSPMEIQWEFAQYSVIEQYMKAGKRAEIEKKVIPMMAPNPSFPAMPCASKINFYLAVKDLEKAAAAEAACREGAIQTQGATTYLIVDAFLFDLREEYDKASKAMEQFIAATKMNDPGINTYLVRFYRKGKQYDKAKAMASEILKRTPLLPELIYELALTNAAEGNKEAALKNVKQALNIWKNADANFVPAQEARALLVQLEG